MERGLASIGVLVLFTVLAVLLSAGLPVIKSEAALKASDWLGFAGNVIAAVLAAVAATVAWIAAQRQIRHAAQQNSVIAYGTLREVLASVSRDELLNHEVGAALEAIILEAKWLRRDAPKPFEELKVAYQRVQVRLNWILENTKKMSEHRAKPWGGPVERAAREKIIKVAGGYAVVALSKIELRLRLSDPLTEGEVAAATFERGPIDDESLTSALKACDEFRDLVEAEMPRVYALIDKYFKAITSEV